MHLYTSQIIEHLIVVKYIQLIMAIYRTVHFPEIDH
jgi:hypothetical protein